MTWQLFSPERVPLIAEMKNWKIKPHESIAKEMASAKITATNVGGIVTLTATDGSDRWTSKFYGSVNLTQVHQNCGALIAYGTDGWATETQLHIMDVLIKNAASQLGDKVVMITGALPKVQGYVEKCGMWTMGLETTSSRKNFTKAMGYAMLDIPKELMAKSGY